MVDRPFILGVGGSSASGKTTLVATIVEALGWEGVVVIEHDCYYREQSLCPNWYICLWYVQAKEQAELRTHSAS